MAYQDTPQASKNNAFCWRTYQPQIDWRTNAAQAAGGATRSRDIEAKRAAGIDPLFIPGMGSAARTGPLDPARLAVHLHRRKETHRG